MRPDTRTMPDRPDHARRQWRIAALLALASASMSVLLLSALPVALFTAAGHDDAWFWTRAQSIVAGDWLGAYDQHTLIKGVGYPLFLAANHVLGTSVSFSQAVLYAAACLLLGHALYRISGKPWWALLAVLLMQWHPMAMTWDRILRDNLSAAQALLVIGCLLQCLFVPHAWKGRLAWSIGAGTALAWLWMTREDGIWILPGVALLFVARLLQSPQPDGDRRRVVLAAAGIAAGFGVTLGSVAAINGAAYGRAETVDVTGAAFGDAMSALQSVRAGERVAYVPVPHAVREAVYAASPTFARLRPYFEGTGRHWTEPGCRQYAQACGDYAGGWFLWAFRDAVASVGGYASPETARAFYRAIDTEIRDACARGALACDAGGVGLMPAVPGAQWRSLPGRLRDGVALAVWRGVSLPQHRSHGSPGMRARMWRFAGGPRVRDRQDVSGKSAAGWFYDPGNAWLEIQCPSSGDAQPVARRPSPDIAAHFGDPAAGDRRFEFMLPPGADCALQAASGNERVHLFDLADASHGQVVVEAGGATLYFDSVGEGIPVDAIAPPVAVAWAHHVHRAYAACMPWLALAGALAFLYASARHCMRRRLSPLYTVAAAAWGLVASRIALLALVDMASFPALNVQYLQPAFPLVALAAVASLACAVSAWRSHRGPGEVRTPPP